MASSRKRSYQVFEDFTAVDQESLCDLRDQIDHSCKREVMYTPPDLYFLTRIVALWKSRESIASIDHTLHMEERKRMRQTFRRCKMKKQVNHAASACFHSIAH